MRKATDLLAPADEAHSGLLDGGFAGQSEDGRVNSPGVAMIDGTREQRLRARPIEESRRYAVTKTRCLALATAAALTITMLAGCTPASPEERVAKLRSKFDARVNGFYVESVPRVQEPAMEDEAAVEIAGEEAETGDDAETGPSAESDGGEGGIEEVSMIQNAHLDLIVQHDNDEMLPGITVEITMVDANQVEKDSWRLWVDTSTLRKANQLQFVHILEDIPYVEGDGFAAEVRKPIPPEEYGEYQEFSSPE